MNRAIGLLFYSILGGILMAAFLMVPGVFRYAFSLGAILLGIRFFRVQESVLFRVLFIVFVVVFSLLFTVVYVMLAYANGWYLQEGYKVPQE